MKTLLKIAIMIVLSFPIYSQWEKIDLKTTNRFYDMKFPENSSGILIGENGYISRTTDYGINWFEVLPPSTDLNTAIAFNNELYSYMSGTDQSGNLNLYSSKDFGNTWEKIDSMQTQVGTSIAFSNNFGYMTLFNPNYGTIMHSSDKGATWEMFKEIPSVRLIDMSVMSDENIWVCGTKATLNYYSNGHVYEYIFPNDLSTDFYSICFLDSTNGYVAGSQGRIFKINADEKKYILSNIGIKDFETIYGVYFLNKLSGYAVGLSLSNRASTVYSTTDGAETWSVEFEISNEYLLDFGANNKYIWVFGLGGIIFRHSLVTDIEISTIETKYINISPNPATGYVEISGVVGEVKVFNVLGVCVITSPPAFYHSGEGSKVRLDVSHLPPGVYFVQSGSHMHRFVKM